MIRWKLAVAAMALFIAGQEAAAASSVTVSTPVSRVGTSDGGAVVTLTTGAGGETLLQFRSWAAPQLIGDHAQSNAVALIGDADGHVLRRAIFRCHRAMTRLAQNLDRQCEHQFNIPAEVMGRAAWLFAFNRLCVWQERDKAASHRQEGCIRDGDTIQAADGFAGKLPELLSAAGDAATVDAGAWRGVRLR